jgi:hypothetical protein
MGKEDESDLNRSREVVYLESERSPNAGRTFAFVPMYVCGQGTNVCPCAPGEGANDHPRMGGRSLPQCLQCLGKHFYERSPKGGRTFASSVCLALWRGFWRTITQGWANVCFLSVFSTLERVLENDRSRMGERLLPQCVYPHYARIKLKEK